MGILTWLDAFANCYEQGYNGMVRAAWPDGLSYAEQENLVVSVLSIIRHEHGKMTNGSK